MSLLLSKIPPKQMLQRESALLKVADIVFTGGPSLYRAKRTAPQRALLSQQRGCGPFRAGA